MLHALIILDCIVQHKLHIHIPIHNIGPRQDKERHNVGIEYELLLEQTLTSMDIPFETEEELRIRGTAKTPDILLSCPVGIRVRRKDYDGIRRSLYKEEETDTNRTDKTQKQSDINDFDDDEEEDDDDECEWKIICWIDSKVSRRMDRELHMHLKNVHAYPAKAITYTL